MKAVRDFVRKRVLAERLLAEWDGKNVKQEPSASQTLQSWAESRGLSHYRRRPTRTKRRSGCISFPLAWPKISGAESSAVQRLVARFSDYTFARLDPEYTEKFPFAISTVTPGRYWVKAVLDRTEPLSQRTDPTYTPQPGDYDNVDSPVITVVAGQDGERVYRLYTQGC